MKLIVFENYTLAMKARSLIIKSGQICELIRTPAEHSKCGCGYSLVVEGNLHVAVEVLDQAGISYVKWVGEDA